VRTSFELNCQGFTFPRSALGAVEALAMSTNDDDGLLTRDKSKSKLEKGRITKCIHSKVTAVLLEEVAVLLLLQITMYVNGSSRYVRTIGWFVVLIESDTQNWGLKIEKNEES
jgi:hypothetical protein